MQISGQIEWLSKGTIIGKVEHDQPTFIACIMSFLLQAHVAMPFAQIACAMPQIDRSHAGVSKAWVRAMTPRRTERLLSQSNTVEEYPPGPPNYPEK